MENNLTRRPERTFDDGRRQGIGTVLISSRCNASLICHCKVSRYGVQEPISRQHRDDHDCHPQPTRLEERLVPSGVCSRKPTCSRKISFGNLPEELLCTILSKLDLKEAVRTSLLSSTWRHTWKLYPKLTFDIVSMYGSEYRTREERFLQNPAFVERGHYVRNFVNNVNTILHQFRGKVVERLELRFGVDLLAQLVGHLDDWVRFAVLLQTKNLILHVSLSGMEMFDYERYMFPLQLLDDGGISCLQHIQLVHVSLRMPSQVIGFPNLRRLYLFSTRVSASDMQRMLSNCPILEWLDLCVVHLNGELKVDRPLSCLLYLRVTSCRVTKIELNAMKLQTFIFHGSLVPINLGETSELHNIVIRCDRLTLEQALSSFSNAFPLVQRLTLHYTCILPKYPWRLENTYRFSHLRYLQLLLHIGREHGDDILSIAYFLEAAPFLEKLDLRFTSPERYVGNGPLRSFSQGQYRYKCLKSMRVYEFRGEKSKVELLLHIVENSPVLENLTIDPRRQYVPNILLPVSEAEERCLSVIPQIATRFIGVKLSPKTKFNLV